MKINVMTTYSCGCSSEIELPIENLRDITEYYVKWGRFYYKLNGDEDFQEIDLNEMVEADTKRPDSVELEQVEE